MVRKRSPKTPPPMRRHCPPQGTIARSFFSPFCSTKKKARRLLAMGRPFGAQMKPEKHPRVRVGWDAGPKKKNSAPRARFFFWIAVHGRWTLRARAKKKKRLRFEGRGQRAQRNWASPPGKERKKPPLFSLGFFRFLTFCTVSGIFVSSLVDRPHASLFARPPTVSRPAHLCTIP